MAFFAQKWINQWIKALSLDLCPDLMEIIVGIGVEQLKFRWGDFNFGF